MPKVPHLSEGDALFLAALVRTPKGNRPHGIISWASEAFQVSRTSIYKLGARIETKLFGSEQAADTASPTRREVLESERAVVVTPDKLDRVILRSTFPGSVSIRPMQTILQEAFDEKRSIGYISQLRLDAGRKARNYTRQLDYSTVKHVIVGRDETFFLGQPVLMIIEPVSSAILLAEVCADRQADTWGTALQIVKDQGLEIGGLIEDMARNYGKSQKLADLSNATVQKDPWHLMRDSARLLTQLEKSAYRAIQKVIDIEKELTKEHAESLSEAYSKAIVAQDKAIEQYDLYASLHDYFCDAFEMVDWRNGEIRDPETARWYLNSIVDQMMACTDKGILRFAKTIRNHQHQLLTFLEWLKDGLRTWRNDLLFSLRNEHDARAFERIVSQHWWAQQTLIAQHKQWQSFADDAQSILDDFTDNYPVLADLATRLRRLFDAAGRTNSVIESINGLLKSFLHDRQSFQSTDSMQAYLDLFVLWHNTRIFERGKRQGQSPFQIAGIETDSDD